MADSEELSEFDIEMNNIKDPKDENIYEPLYKVMTDNKIAVSKKEGKLWYERLQIAKHETAGLRQSWKHISDVYKGENKPNEDINKKRLRLDEQDKTFENILWSNTNAISRETIMKLPHIELTGRREDMAMTCTAYEHFINCYMEQVGNCGLNMKEKLIKTDICAQLTNKGVIRLDWVDKINSDILRDEVSRIEAQLAECKTMEQIKDLEGKLYAINEKLEGSGFDGAQLTLVNPEYLFIDPNSQLESGLDADWMIEERLEYEHILKAKYASKEGTVYAGRESQISAESEMTKDSYMRDQDYDSDYILGGNGQQYVKEEKLKTVKVYYIWDRLKKRVYLYQDGSWDYPLWVWNDPYGLRQFFPYYILHYNVNPVDSNTMSEAAYYLPLMNSLNKINSQIDMARDRAFNVTLVNRRARLEEKDLQNMTNGKPGFVQVDIPEGSKIQDVFMGMPTSGFDNQLLFNKTDIYSVVQKMCSADAISRGEEYKTNTTNQAIQQYSQGRKVIVGIRIDRIMNYYIRLVRDIMYLALNKFDIDDILKYCSGQDAQQISMNKIDVYDPDLHFQADDTIEPTAAMKKQEAAQLAQLFGQFASASPAIIVVVLKMMSRAFNEIVITDEDWQMIMQGFQQQQEAQQQQAQMQQAQMQQQQQQADLKAQGMMQKNQMAQQQGQMKLQQQQNNMRQQAAKQQAAMVNQAAAY